jgi:hypothetical protein
MSPAGPALPQFDGADAWLALTIFFNPATARYARLQGTPKNL